MVQIAFMRTHHYNIFMHATPLPDIVILLLVAVVAVTLFRALRLSPVLGYLVAGLAIGPSGFVMVASLESTAAIAELGVVLLLFLIGLELSWDRLKKMRVQVFGVGGVQMLITAPLFAWCAMALGLSAEAAVLVGGGLALSSTALVLQVLEERHESATQTGRLSLAILIMQDLAVLPLLVLVPVLAQPEGEVLSTMARTFAQALVALVAIIVIGRVLLRPIFRVIARLDIHELFVAMSLLTVLGISWATETVGLSAALGAFLAGLLLAETEFVHQIEADVKPYKGLLMGLFFMTVGMRIDVTYLLENWLWVLLAAFALLLAKATILYGVLRGFGYSRRSSGHTALLLAQGGEFGFILFGLASAAGVLEASVAELLLVIIALTMALTPLLDRLGARFERQWLRHHRPTLEALSDEAKDMREHVVIAGYGFMGEVLAKKLAREGIAFIAMDTEPRRVQAGRRNQHPVYFGDATRADVLAAMGAKHAKLIVVTMREESKVLRAMRTLRSEFPDKPILCRAKDHKRAALMQQAGATQALPELQLSSMRVMSMILNAMDWPEPEIARVMNAMRGEAVNVPGIGV